MFENCKKNIALQASTSAVISFAEGLSFAPLYTEATLLENKYSRSATSTVSHSALKRLYHASSDSFFH